MKILVACEESQRVAMAFREKGHIAYSADIQDCSGGHPEYHFKGDVLQVLNGNVTFYTEDFKRHYIDKWDMILAFPPCTHLAVSGSSKFEQKRKDGRQRDGIEFFVQFLNARCDKICVENPVNIIGGNYIKKYFPDLCEQYNLPKKCTQIIQPYYFGHAESKKTCLWLKGLEPLKPTNIIEMSTYNNQDKNHQNQIIVDGKVMAWNNPLIAKIRSKTYPGVAKAMAEQWG